MLTRMDIRKAHALSTSRSSAGRSPATSPSAAAPRPRPSWWSARFRDGRRRGRGECVPYARYGETVEGVAAAIERPGGAVARGLDRERLQSAMPPGAARNALDCAFWDLEAKRAGRPAHALAGLAAPQPLTTAYTISLGTPEAMADAAAQAARPAAAEDQARRRRRPASASPPCARPRRDANLIVDANEGWTRGQPRRQPARLRGRPASRWSSSRCPRAATRRSRASRGRSRSAPTRACTTARRSPRSCGHYDAVNIKLDKTGGLTEALAHGGRGASGSALRSWSAAWSRPRCRWRRRCCSRSRRGSSISTARCCSRTTARTGCATRAASFTRRHLRCGDSADDGTRISLRSIRATGGGGVRSPDGAKRNPG